jgi:hypothetical protein
MKFSSNNADILPDDIIQEGLMAGNILYVNPVINHGATSIRAGWAARMVIDGRLSRMPVIIGYQKLDTPIRKSTGQPDLAACLALEKKMIDDLKPEGKDILKVVGAGFPGAWLENGRVYPNTVNTNRELEDFPLARKFSAMMGKGWETVVNNDAVAHALAISQGFVADIDRFPAAGRVLEKTGKIVVLMPATGFGGGAFIYKKGSLTAVDGPVQFFDIALEEGDGVIDPSHRFLTPEDVAAGAGVSFQMRGSFLKDRYSEVQLSTQNAGSLLVRMAFSKEDGIKADEREFALSLYAKAAKGLAKTMWLINGGIIEGEHRKLVVNDPPSLETDFWESIKGTRVIILGGWLTHPDVKAYMKRALREELDALGLFNVGFIFADDIAGVDAMVENDTIGLAGAAMLAWSRIGA